MIRLDGLTDSRITTEMVPPRPSSGISTVDATKPDNSSNKKIARSLFSLISLLVQIFCFVTCLILWKDGKVMESARIISNGDRSSSSSNSMISTVEQIVKTNDIIKAEIQQMNLSIEQKSINTSKEIAYILAKLEEKINNLTDAQAQKNQDYSLEISDLSQTTGDIWKELSFLTLDNRPATIRNTSLGLTLQGYAIKTTNDTYKLITQSGSIISPFNPGNGWVAKGAVEEGNGFNLYMMKRGSPLQFEKWTLTSSASFLLSTTISHVDALYLENLYSFDYDEDRKYGPQIQSLLSNINGLAFGNTAVGYGLQKTSMDRALLVYYEGFVGGYITIANLNSIKTSWLLVGAVAEASGPGYLVFWKSATNLNSYSSWALNSTGHYQSSFVLSYSGMMEYERMYNYDILNDGRVGVRFVGSVAQIGLVTFGTTDAGYYGIKKGSDPIIFVTSQDYVLQVPGGQGQYLAVGAQGTSTGYNLFWIHSGGYYALWTVNALGVCTGGTTLTAQQFFQYEISLNYDLSRNGIIGG